jgi:hypothetical protein
MYGFASTMIGTTQEAMDFITTILHPGVDGVLTYARQQTLCYIAGGDKSLRDEPWQPY